MSGERCSQACWPLTWFRFCTGVAAFCSHAVWHFIPSSTHGALTLGFWACISEWVDLTWVHTTMHMNVMTLFVWWVYIWVSECLLIVCLHLWVYVPHGEVYLSAHVCRVALQVVSKNNGFFLSPAPNLGTTWARLQLLLLPEKGMKEWRRPMLPLARTPSLHNAISSWFLVVLIGPGSQGALGLECPWCPLEYFNGVQMLKREDPF